jgi:hypothetical protein
MVKPKDGTELLYEGLLQRLGPEDLQGINLFLGKLFEELLKSFQINIFWNRHSINHPAVQGYLNKELLNRIQHFVYVSN